MRFNVYSQGPKAFKGGSSHALVHDNLTMTEVNHVVWRTLLDGGVIVKIVNVEDD